MEVIDADWIKARLTGERGEQSRLADAMGIDNDKVSKILKGKRRVQVNEIPAVLRFFGEAPPVEDADLELVISRWSRLPLSVRHSIRTIVEAFYDDTEDEDDLLRIDNLKQPPQTALKHEDAPDQDLEEDYDDEYENRLDYDPEMG